MIELIAELREVELLAGIDDKLLEGIAEVVSIETIHSGETLVTEGSVGTDLYFVRQGNFLVTVLDGETPTKVGQLGPGDVIGEAQMIAGGRRTATVTAMEECVVIHLPHAEFDALMFSSKPLRETVAKVIRHRLREAALHIALPRAVGNDPELLDLLSRQAKWVRLERGEVLWEQGTAADGWYILVSGEVSIIANEHGTRRQVGTVRRGEVFGEMSLIRSTPRTATVVAARDCWLARFEAQLLKEEVLTRKGALRTLVFSLTDRLSARMQSSQNSARVIAIVPRDTDLDTADLVRQLTDSLGGRGLAVGAGELRRDGVIGDAEHLPPEHPGWLRFQAWVESQRQDMSYLLLITSGKDDSWTRAAVDQADIVLLFVNADADPARNDMERSVLDRFDKSQTPPVWLVLEHTPDRIIPSGTADWLKERDLEHHAHLRRYHERDIARLARWLMGQMVGIALSGGGARGFVHLGVAAAMFDSGHELDLIAGTGAGSMAGGLLARDEPPEELMARALKSIEAHGNPFFEVDLPIISSLKSRKLRDGLQATFGEVAIEDNWIPLRIVATDLTESRRVVFDHGPVWHRVYAASSPPGVMVPVKEDNQLLCDGGLVDNLPVSVLREEDCTLKFASYVGSAPALPTPAKSFPTSWGLLFDRIFRRQRHQDVASLVTTLLQCVSVPAAAQLEDAKAAADVFFQPDVSSFSTTEIDAVQAMFEAGKDHAQAVLKG